MSMITFSTIDPVMAQGHFSSPRYNWLSLARKVYVLNHLGDGSMRVQDPVMYPNPQIEFYPPLGEDHYTAIMGINDIPLPENVGRTELEDEQK